MSIAALDYNISRGIIFFPRPEEPQKAHVVRVNSHKVYIYIQEKQRIFANCTHLIVIF